MSGTQTLARKYEELKGKLKEQDKDIDKEVERLVRENKAFTRAGALYVIGREFEIEYSPKDARGVWLGNVPNAFGKERHLLLTSLGEVKEVRGNSTDIKKWSV